MIIFPAIDIQDGKVVRLRQGKKDQSSVFDDNPAQMAKKWQKQGCKWLHIVDLDGAFADASPNFDVIAQITASAAAPVQVGGGIRNMDVCRRYFDAGAARLIIGTAALENPELFQEMCAEWPGKIGASLDAENGRLKSRGWLRDANLQVEDILEDIFKAGASFIIYTDISRDGMQSGLNFPALRALLAKTPLPVIAAGGVSNMQDIKEAHELSLKTNLEGVICGRALYEHTLDLAECLQWLEKQKN